MNENIFLESNWYKTFKEDGYIIVDLLSEDDIKFCLKKYYNIENDFISSNDQNRYNTLEIENYAYRSSVYNHLAPFLQEKIAQFVKGYNILGINFAVKKPYGDEFPPHVDDAHADNHHLGINVWIPLTNVAPENGSLYLFKGSQKIDIPMRGIGLPFPYLKYNEFIKQHTKPVTLKLGQAIIFNDKILHGSGKNNTDEERPAIIVGLISAQANPKVYVRYASLGHGRAELFDAPSEFFFKFNFEKRPGEFNSYGIFDYVPTTIDEKEFKDMIISS